MYTFTRRAEKLELRLIVKFSGENAALSVRISPNAREIPKTPATLGTVGSVLFFRARAIRLSRAIPSRRAVAIASRPT